MMVSLANPVCCFAGRSVRVLLAAVFLQALTVNHTRAAQCGVEARMLFANGTMAWAKVGGAGRLVDDAVAGGFNALLPTVWHGRGVTWLSSLTVHDPVWNLRAIDDPLQRLIAQAHDAGLEVHVSVSVAARHRDFLPEFYDEGTPGKAFDLQNPGFRNFLTEMFRELASGYEIDGLNLDFIRTRGVCVSPRCSRDYADASGGRDLLDDARRYRFDANAAAALAQWNGVAVESVVRAAREVMQTHRPGAVLSVASHVGSGKLKYQGADPVKWSNRDWIDAILHMDYALDGDFKRRDIERGLAALDEPSRLIFLVGNFEKARKPPRESWPREPSRLVHDIREARSLAPDGSGVGLFQHRFLTSRQISALRADVFAESAATPWASASPGRRDEGATVCGAAD